MNTSLTLRSDADCREASRTHMFVVATLYSGDKSSAVRVRNMSVNGALLEGDDLPEAGSSLTLRRGHLEARGQIAWQMGRRAGISFHDPVNITDWLSNPGASQQARVDSIVAQLKSAAGRSQTSQLQANLDPIPRDDRQELALLRADLAKLSKSLASDSYLVAHHHEIQLLDIALQRIDRLLSL